MVLETCCFSKAQSIIRITIITVPKVLTVFTARALTRSNNANLIVTPLPSAAPALQTAIPVIVATFSVELPFGSTDADDEAGEDSYPYIDAIAAPRSEVVVVVGAAAACLGLGLTAYLLPVMMMESKPTETALPEMVV